MSSQNFLSPLEFELTVARMPNVAFSVQRTSIPGITAQAVPFSTMLHTTFVTPDRLTYAELSVSFLADEDMSNYLEVFNWLTSVTFPERFSQYASIKESREGIYSDMTLLIKNNSKRSNISILFKNAFPTSLSEIPLDTTQSDVLAPEVLVGFQYDYFVIEKT